MTTDSRRVLQCNGPRQCGVHADGIAGCDAGFRSSRLLWFPQGDPSITRAHHRPLGYVVDPFDIDGWIHAIRIMASEPTVPRVLGLAASRRDAIHMAASGKRLYYLLVNAARDRP
jgi:hypothetical protein